MRGTLTRNEPIRTVISGVKFPECPRWHDDALWFSDLRSRRILRAGSDGTLSIVLDLPDDTPGGLGWLPDGRLLFVASERRCIFRLEAHGSLVVHADLNGLVGGEPNDMVVGLDGTAYVGDMGETMADPATRGIPGQTIRVLADGSCEVVVRDLLTPNGHALSADGRLLLISESGGARVSSVAIGPDGVLGERRTFANIAPAGAASVVELSDGSVLTVLPDGMCLDAEGAVWVADPIGARLLRIRNGGEIADVVSIKGRVRPFACVLGGSDRRTLFICLAEIWRGDPTLQPKTGRIDAVSVAIPGAGRP